MSHENLVKYWLRNLQSKPVFVFILYLFFFSAYPIHPQEAEKTPKTEESFEKLLEKELNKPTEISAERPSWIWQFFKTTIILGFFLAFFWAIYRAYLFKKNLPTTRAKAFRLIYSYPLAPGKFLQVVEIPNRFLILGVSETGIQLIREVTDRAEMDLIRIECEKDKQEPKVDFLAELGKELAKKAKEIFGPKASGMNFTLGDFELSWQDFRRQSQSRIEKLRQEKENLREKSHE